jgi:hypothetical protein
VETIEKETLTEDPALLSALDAVAEYEEAHAAGDRVLTKPAPVDEPAIDAAVRWEATFAPEGKATDDGRMFWPGSISWRELPLSLMAMTETPGEGGHAGAELSGRIDEIWRDEKAGLIRAAGVFDKGEQGSEIARLVADGTLTGLSVDIAAREFEIVPRSALFDEEGNLRPDALEREPEEEPDLLEILFGGEPEDPPVFVVTDGVIGMATVCPFPAFEDASISVTAGGGMIWRLTLQGGFTLVREAADREPTNGTAAEGEDAQSQSLSASAAGLAPLKPPRAWFADPKLAGLTPLTVTDEGRVYGHAAAWGTCHIGIPEGCTQPPRSGSNYAYFLLGEIETEEGDVVATGRVTLATNHADRRLGRAAATEHYDNTGAVVADVVAGEDAHGIWVSGGLRPEVSAERVREFRGSVLSGDWRSVNGQLELVALLACNVPGFPIPRTRALVAAGGEGNPEVLTLVAAGIHAGELSEDDIRRLRVLRERAVGGLAALAALARREEAADDEEMESPHGYEDDGTGHCAECGMTKEEGNHYGGGNPG